MRNLFVSAALSALWLGCGSMPSPADGGTPCDQTKVGNICTIAGSGANGYFGDDGPALKAQFSLPQDTLTAPDGSMFIIDWNNHRIRKLTADGKVVHVAGRGELGGGLEEVPGSDFNHPTAIAFDPTGTKLLIAAWHNSKIITLDLTSGTLTSLCGDGRRAYWGDEFAAFSASLDLPTSIAFDPDGNLVVMDQANQVIRTIDSAGIIHRRAGQCVIDAPAPAGPGKCAAGVDPVACPAALTPSGKTTCGTPADFCGKPCTPSYGGDEGPALSMRISQPFGQSADPGGRMVFDPAGNLIFADTGNGLIRKIDVNGVVHRIAGTPPGADGKPVLGYSGDEGPATEAMLNRPTDLALGTDGTLYFTDVYNHCVRSITTDGKVHTVAGVCGQAGFSGDDGPANQALLKRPYGVEFVAGGTLHITDTGNNVVRSIKL